MKIAVSTRGKTPASSVAPFSGRKDDFVIYDSNNFRFTHLVHSPGQLQSEQDEYQSAEMFVDAGIEVLVVSGIAFETARLLGRAGIRIYECVSATVWEAIQALKLNLLESIGNDAGGPDGRGVSVKS
jgi:predicted Fe-Mo cluster-binding NifX family protein